MNHALVPDQSSALIKAKAAFAQWREQHNGRRRIPEELWAQAAGMAGCHGVTQVSSFHGLNPHRLHERVGKNTNGMELIRRSEHGY